MAILRKEETPLSKLQGWSDNPRGILAKDYERLKKQITDLGIYQPLVVNEDYIVLSGNMRLKAFQELHIDPAWVVVVEARDKDTMIKYALSANDAVGYYEDQPLAELLQDVKIDLEDYKVNFGKTSSLKDVLNNFGGEDIDFSNIESTEDREKQFKEQTVTCPHCTKSFTIEV